MEEWLVAVEKLFGHLIENHVFRSAAAEKTAAELHADLTKIRQDVTGTAPAPEQAAATEQAAPAQPAAGEATDAS